MVSPLVTRTPDVPTLAAGRLRFRAAAALSVGEAAGDWRLEVTGPDLIRDRWDRGLRLAGAAGLWGLRLDGRGAGHLLVTAGRRAAPEPDRRVRVVEEASRIDRHPALSLTFPQPDRVPWPWLRIELRRLRHQGTWPVPQGWLLGLAMVDLPGRVPIPLLLEQQDPTG